MKYSPDLMRATQRKTEMRLGSEEVVKFAINMIF